VADGTRSERLHDRIRESSLVLGRPANADFASALRTIAGNRKATSYRFLCAVSCPGCHDTKTPSACRPGAPAGYAPKSRGAADTSVRLAPGINPPGVANERVERGGSGEPPWARAMRGGTRGRTRSVGQGYLQAGYERPRAEWIEVPVPALVNEEMFALAQEQLEKNEHHVPRCTIEPTLLRGILVCEQCGYGL
jgi:hypothetical protein